VDARHELICAGRPSIDDGRCPRASDGTNWLRAQVAQLLQTGG